MGEAMDMVDGEDIEDITDLTAMDTGEERRGLLMLSQPLLLTLMLQLMLMLTMDTMAMEAMDMVDGEDIEDITDLMAMDTGDGRQKHKKIGWRCWHSELSVNSPCPIIAVERLMVADIFHS